MFTNRQEAGKLLSNKLKVVLSERYPTAAQGAVVIGLPRGGIPVASEIAIGLGLPLDLMVSKKIGAPGNPELAIGAVSSAGDTVIYDELASFFGKAKPDAEINKLRLETKSLEERWLSSANIKARPELKDKLVILVDDGIATGMTTMAAIKSLRRRGVRTIVIAVPVLPLDTKAQLEAQCDLLVYLLAPSDFQSVGAFYQDFHQVSNEEVVEELTRASAQKPCIG